MIDQPQNSTLEEIDALSVVRMLIEAGVPVFAAPPCPATMGGACARRGHENGKVQHHLPKAWQNTRPGDTGALDAWLPGWGLGAVGGHLVDMIDVDPRHDGDRSVQEMAAAGDWPETYGSTETPSGGQHHLIAPLGEARAAAVLPGIDYQGGKADGSGRAFIWLPPTVRRSKVDGVPRAYRWTRAVDLEPLRTSRDVDDPDHPSAGVLRRLKSAEAGKDKAPDQQKQAESVSAGSNGSGQHRYEDAFRSADSGDVRLFTQAEAQAFVKGSLLAVGAARVGEIEERANAAAAQLSHFVPEFWTAERAMGWLMKQLKRTAYDENGPSEWTADKFWPVLRGENGRVRDAWKAQLRPEPAAELESVEVKPDKAAILRAKMLDPDQLEARPRPRPLIHTLLSLDSLAWLIGAPGSFKSFLALDMAAHVSAGLPWRGMRVTKGMAIYIAAEGASGMTLRMKAWRKSYGVTPELLTLPESVQASDPEAWATMVHVCRGLRPVFIVIDTQARNTVGMEENDNTAMGVFVERLEALKRATGACVMPLHHTGRNGGDARGASAIDGAQDTELKIVRAMPRDSLAARVSVEKQKDGEDGWEIPLTLRRVVVGKDEDTGADVTTLIVEPYDPFKSAEDVDAPPMREWKLKLADHQREAIDVLTNHSDFNGATNAEISSWIAAERLESGLTGDAAKIKGNSLSTALATLVKAGHVQRLGRGRVVLSEYAEEPAG